MPNAQTLVLSGQWTALHIGVAQTQLEAIRVTAGDNVWADAAGIDALDTVGAWLLNKHLLRFRGTGAVPTLDGLREPFQKLLSVVEQGAVSLLSTS